MAKSESKNLPLTRRGLALLLLSASVLSSCGIAVSKATSSEPAESLSSATETIPDSGSNEASMQQSSSDERIISLEESSEESSEDTIEESSSLIESEDITETSQETGSSEESLIEESSQEESSFEEETSIEEEISSFESEEETVSSEEISLPEEVHITFSSNDEDFGKVTGSKEQTLSAGEGNAAVKAVPNLGYRFVSWSDGSTSETRENEVFTKDEDIVAIFDYDALEMPIFSIYTEDKAPIVSKETYIPGALTIKNSDGHDEENMTLGIRGRGNYSWSGTEKKSYRIKFDSKTNLLGQGKGKAKSWTLLAVHCDKTLLRNDAAFFLGRQLPSLPFTSTSSFVELYLNGSYDGVYEVCDQMQVNPYRVDIDDSGSEEDIGYLVEIDKNASEDVLRTNNGMTYELKSEYVNQAQVDFITDYLNRMIDAFEDGDREQVDALVDIPSIVESYIVEELFKNLDVGWGSFYLTKPKGEKLRFGPVWDFDLCAGNADNDSQDQNFRSPYYTYVGSDYFRYDMQQSQLFLALRETTWFMEEVRNRYNEIGEELSSIVPHINEVAEANEQSFNRNFKRWRIFSQRINREPANVLRLRSHKAQVNFLTEWLTTRIKWLGDYLNGLEEDLSYDYYWAATQSRKE